KQGDVSCNSCHNLSMGGDDDGAAMKMSGRNIKRSAPSVWNVAYMSTYFWDARAASLEEQATEHLLDPNIMAMQNATFVASRLKGIKGYVTIFANTFKDKKISLKNISKALASFQRSLIVANSRADQYIAGNKAALNKKEERGYHLFQKQGCLSCHFGTNFAGPAPGPGLKMGEPFFELYPTIRGSQYEEKYDMVADMGNFHVTLDPERKLFWRVPSLRNIADTAPYFHNNAVNDLHEAVRVMNRVQFNYPITEDQVDDIVAFLKTLTGVYPAIELPRLPDSSGISLVQ
ncbi:MAG TPA: c-type cytochrome, partial [Gammaproteobacteria bacterium]|nr:c-type cytochrome [Gammaproteobacteria bacterium]